MPDARNMMEMVCGGENADAAVVVYFLTASMNSCRGSVVVATKEEVIESAK